MKTQIKTEEKGITLIALVVTIIVLLILAGISIAMLSGSNGVLDKAAEAVEKTSNAELEERVKLEYLASYDNNGEFNLEMFKENINNNLGIHPDDMTDQEDGGLVFEYKGYDVTVTKAGDVTIGGDGVPTVKEVVTPDDQKIIGKKLQYKTDADVNEWYPYLDDGKNLYLISADYIENSKISSSVSNKATNGAYKMYWNSPPTSLNMYSNVNNEFRTNWYKFSNSNSMYNNGYCLTTLLQTTYWENFTGKYGDLAIGSPTFEILRESWNKRYTSNQISSLSPSSYGYTNTLTLNAVGNTDPAYVITETSKASYYWIASPYNSQNYIYRMNNTGIISNASYNDSNQALRPVVRMKKNVGLRLVDGEKLELFDKEEDRRLD